METLAKIAGIFGLSWFSFWSGIPAGLALSLNPLVVIATTTLSYVSGVALVLAPGDKIRDWVRKRWGRGARLATSDDKLIHRMWRRFGVIGFGIVAPMTVGAQIGVILGLALNIPRRQLFIWMSAGALAWSLFLTAALLLGLLGAESI